MITHILHACNTRRESPSGSLAEMEQDPDVEEEESPEVVAKGKGKEKEPEPEMRAVVYPPWVKTEEPATNLEELVVLMEVDKLEAPVKDPATQPEVPVEGPVMQPVEPDVSVKIEEVPATIVMVRNSRRKVKDGKVVDHDGKRWRMPKLSRSMIEVVYRFFLGVFLGA